MTTSDSVNPALPIALAAAASLASVGCGARSGKSECQRRFEAGDYAGALGSCETRFASENDPVDGTRAVTAAFMSGHPVRGEELLAHLDADHEHRSIGWAWHAAGDFRRHQGDRKSAAAAYQRALAIHTRFDAHRNAALDQLALSDLTWIDADYEAAGAHAAAAEALARRAKEHGTVARALQKRLSISYDVGAEASMRETLVLLRAAVGADDPGVRSAEGLLHVDAGRGAMAHASFQQALELTPHEAFDIRRATLINLAQADLERSRPDHAVAHLDAAAALVEGDIAETALAAYRSRVANALGEGARAREIAEQSLAAAPISDWRWELELEAGLGAVASGDNAGGERHYLAAISALEVMRGAHDRADYKQSMLARKRRPYNALVDLYVAADRAADALAIAERARARTLVEAITRRSRGSVPPAARTAQRVLAVSIDDAIASLGGAIGVAYYRTTEAVYRFEVERGLVSVHRLSVTLKELDLYARRLRANPDDRSAAERLGEILAPPVARQLYIVADGELATAPLAAIRVDGRYLAERSQLAFAPSLSTLAALAARPASQQTPAVVIGDPRGDLEAARDEAVAVARGLGTPARLGSEATLDQLDLAAHAKVLHLATHADDRGLSLADGVLSADEIVSRGLAPSLVVLATCTGAAPRDGGLWGSLAGSFLVAGSRVVLASPATLDDADARRLVLAFYTAGGVDAPAAALTLAQRALIRRGHSPSTWSSIVAIGLAHTSPKTSIPPAKKDT